MTTTHARTIIGEEHWEEFVRGHQEVVRRLQEKHEEELTSRDTYWKERVGDVKFDIEALRGSPRDTDIEYARAITDVHKILDTLLDNLK